MDQAKFVAIMPKISTDLVDYIAMQQKIGEEEALQKLYVEDMPLVVIIDSEGNNLYEDGRNAYKKRRELS